MQRYPAKTPYSYPLKNTSTGIAGIPAGDNEKKHNAATQTNDAENESANTENGVFFTNEIGTDKNNLSVLFNFSGADDTVLIVPRIIPDIIRTRKNITSPY